jgi:hypothetical protein
VDVKFKKPQKAFFYTLAWLVVLLFTRLDSWLSRLLFLFGGVLGTYLWEFESVLDDLLNQTETKPVLRNVVTQVALAVIAFYGATSSTSMLGIGLALGLFGRSVAELLLAWKDGDDLSRWFWMMESKVGKGTVKVYVVLVICCLILISIKLSGL